MKPGVTAWTLSTGSTALFCWWRFPPSHAGTITVYEDSTGTLNDFLGAMTEDDARPRHCAV
ncbi:prophage tail fiber family protein [Escherichia coli 2747800]|nr:prophage tail fiber family protein [Escherichia coli 2747800]